MIGISGFHGKRLSTPDRGDFMAPIVPSREFELFSARSVCIVYTKPLTPRLSHRVARERHFRTAFDFSFSHSFQTTLYTNDRIT